MSAPRLRPAELIDLLAKRVDGRPSALFFDADGTLWSGDVAEDVFGIAIAEGLLRDDARDALSRRARDASLDDRGDATAIAKTLFEAYLAGTFPERDVCEIMAWCFAGFSVAELDALTDRAIDTTRLASRLFRPLEPVLTWARERGIATLIVSASPGPIVRRCARLWDFAPEHVAGTEPALASGVLEARLALPVPYGAEKRTRGLGMLEGRRWLGSFGDSPFDGQLLMSAEVAVAVRPKPGLVDLLEGHPHAVVLGE